MKNLFVVALLIGSALVALPASAQSPFAAPIDGLLLLKNGRSLSGTISRSGDFYLVATPESELQIRTHEVEAVCRDWEEAYRHKSTRINVRSADDHLELAQWCIECQLFGHAARELTEAYRIDDLHPRVPLLERRIRAAMTEPKPTEPVVAPTPVISKIDDEALEAIAKSVSHETLLDFTTRIQPLLVNYCATAGCHGPRATSDFQLHRVYLHETRDPRLLRANLATVLQRIDRKQPQASKLLTVPIAAHGGAKKPIFHAHNVDHYRQLAAWVARAAAGPNVDTASKVPASVDSPAGELLQRIPMAPPYATPAPAPIVESAATQPTLLAVPPAELPPPPAPAAPTATGVDPFDPEVFNRRKTAAAKAEPEATPAKP